jgi:hypothetical protein
VRQRQFVLSIALGLLWLLGVFIGPLVGRAMFRERPGPLQPIESDGWLVGPISLAETQEHPYSGKPPLEGDPIWGSGPLLGAGPLQGAGLLPGAISTLVVGPLQGVVPVISAGPLAFGPGSVVLATSLPVALTGMASPPPEPQPGAAIYPASRPLSSTPSLGPSPSEQSTRQSTPSPGGGSGTQVLPSTQLTSSTASSGGGSSSPIVPTFVCISGCAPTAITPVLPPTCQELASGCN